MKWFAILAPAAVVFWLVGDALAAGGTIEARVSAVAFAPMDGVREIEVRLYDDSDANKALKTAIENRLTGAGYILGGNAPVILSFERSSTVGNGNVPPEAPQSLITMKGGTNSKDEYSASLNLLKIKTGEEGSPGASYGGAVRLEVAISSRSNGRRLWQGWAVADSTGRESADIAAALIEPLVGAIGKTVRAQQVDAVLP